MPPKNKKDTDDNSDYLQMGSSSVSASPGSKKAVAADRDSAASLTKSRQDALDKGDLDAARTAGHQLQMTDDELQNESCVRTTRGKLRRLILESLIREAVVLENQVAAKKLFTDLAKNNSSALKIDDDLKKGAGALYNAFVKGQGDVTDLLNIAGIETPSGWELSVGKIKSLHKKAFARVPAHLKKSLIGDEIMDPTFMGAQITYRF